MNVRQIIGQKPIKSVATISANETLSRAASELASKKIGALVVSEAGASVEGILSERDLVRRSVDRDVQGQCHLSLFGCMLAGTWARGACSLKYGGILRFQVG